jgi:hypothetical protein
MWIDGGQDVFEEMKKKSNKTKNAAKEIQFYRNTIDAAGVQTAMYTCFGKHLASTKEIAAACALVCTGVYNVRQLEYAHVAAVSLLNRVGNVGEL